MIATQEQAHFAAAQARQVIEDMELLAMLLDAGTTLEEARAVFHQEAN